MIHTNAILAGILVAVLATEGLTSEHPACNSAECNESLRSMRLRSFAMGGLNPWPLNGSPLHLCFIRDSTLTVAEFNILRDRVIQTLNKTWGRIPGVSFVSGCTAPAMNITLKKDSNGYGSCGLGNGSSCMIAGVVSNLDSLDSVAVHEVGHGLGLLHEHQRPDAPNLCDNEKNILKGCQQCTAATCSTAEANACWFSVPKSSSITVSADDKTWAINQLSAGIAKCSECSKGTCIVGACDNGTCTENSYWGCFGKNPTFGTINVSNEDHDIAQWRVNDRVPINNGWVLTKYDPASIMSYCSGLHGRTDAIPTDNDMLGMEMLYSINRNYGIGCGDGCFETTAGLVTLTTGSIVSEWIARGSVGIPFQIKGTSEYVYSYPVISLNSDTSSISYAFKDAVGNTRNGSGTVTKSNPIFTAILGTLSVAW